MDRIRLLAALGILFCLASSSRAQVANPSNDPANYSGLSSNTPAPNSDGRPPEGFDLPPEHLAYIERLLEYWEQSSAQIKRCECDFQRWDYDASIVSKRDPKDNRLIAHRVVRGKIRFASPDKAQYESDEMWSYQNPEAENPYVQLTADGDHERWICDGTTIYEYDFANKRLYENKIPPDQLGAGLLDSPLPFLFGANKEKILQRYWLRIATPPEAKDQYWLIAVPKRQADSQAYSKVEIILDQADFLPRSLHIYSVNYDPATTAVSQAIEFTNRRINSQLSGFQDFLGLFLRPRTPAGFQRVESLGDAAVPAAQGSSPNDSRTGALPTNPKQ